MAMKVKHIKKDKMLLYKIDKVQDKSAIVLLLLTTQIITEENISIDIC
jgi:hypothetical protein